MPAERKPRLPTGITIAAVILLALAFVAALLRKSTPPVPAPPPEKTIATSAQNHGTDPPSSAGPELKPASPSRSERQLLAKYGAPMSSLAELAPRWQELERAALPDATRRRMKSLLVRTASQVAPDYMSLLSGVCDLAGEDEGMALMGELRDPEEVYSGTGGIPPAETRGR